MSWFILRIGFAHIGRVGSVFVTIAITIERYVIVCHPTSEFKGKFLLIPLPIISAILYNIPKFFEIEATEHSSNDKVGEQIPSPNNTSYTDSAVLEKLKVEDIGYRGTALRLNYWYVIFYVTWSKLLVVEIIPWIMIIVLNTRIWNKIRKFQSARNANFPRVGGK